jgi:hypothetical protein
MGFVRRAAKSKEPLMHVRWPLGEVFRSQWRGSALIVSVGGPIVTLVCWYFGADDGHSVAIAACVCAVGVAWVAWPEEQQAQWHDHDGWQSGGRSDVVRLSWTLYRRRGLASAEAVRRVQAIGRRRLALHQLDPLEPSHAPAIERLVGGAALAVLRGSESSLASSQPPTMRSLVHCLDALDALDPVGADIGRQMSVSSRLRAMLRRRGPSPVLALLRRRTRRAG